MPGAGVRGGSPLCWWAAMLDLSVLYWLLVDRKRLHGVLLGLQ